jgi:hypothetical protein
MAAVTTQAVTTPAPAITFGPRDEPGECVVCDIELPARGAPLFRYTDPHGETCGDCADDVDPARGAALRTLNAAYRAACTLPAETPSIDAYFTSIASGLRLLRDHVR